MRQTAQEICSSMVEELLVVSHPLPQTLSGSDLQMSSVQSSSTEWTTEPCTNRAKAWETEVLVKYSQEVEKSAFN